MITRTTIGADFEGALSYGAGVRQGDKSKKAELIGSSNLVDVGNPRGMAAEMRAVADERTKCKNPVWHTSLSWAEGEQLSTAQKLQAAERYCELIGADWDAHQVAVYEHHDTKHEHIHIYFNRVPVYGGPAIDTGHNYARNLKAIKLITQELGLAPLPAQRQSIRDSRPPVQDTRQEVRAALVEALANPQLQSIEQLQAHLATQGIEMRTKRSQAGQLVGVSFKQGEAAVTGQEVGMKAAQLREHYEPAQRQVQMQQPAPPPLFRLVEVPAAKLAQFGMSVAKLEEAGQLQKLLNGHPTDLLAMQGGAQRDKPLIPFEGKLLLHRAANGAVELRIELPRSHTAQQAPPLVPVVPAPAQGPPSAAAEQRPTTQPPAPKQEPVAAQPSAPAQQPVATPLPVPELKPEPPEPEAPRVKLRGPRR